MKVSCPACDSKYTIADEKVAGRKVKVRCKSCGGQILINGTIPPPAPDGTENDGADAAASFKSERPSANADRKSSPSAFPKAASSQLNGSPDADDGITWSVNVSEADERSLKTHEVVAGYLSGEFAGEVYVWHDGMTDWCAIPDVPDLAAAIAAAQEKKSAPGAAPAPKPKTLPAAGKPGKQPDLVTSAPSPDAGKKVAARAAGAKRPQSAHDLFAAASTAGSEMDVPVAADDDDAAQKKTGARNENSVLFSLDALKAGITAAPAQQPAKVGTGKKAPATPRKKLEDLMVNASTPLAAGPAAGPMLLNANQALLTAPAPPPPPPKPEPVAAVDSAAASAAAMIYAKEKEKTKRMLIGVIAAIVAIGAIAGIAIGMTKNRVEPAAQASATKPAVSAVAALPAATTEPTKAPEPLASEAKPAESAAPSTPAAAGQKPVAVANAGTKTGGGTATLGPKTDVKKDAPKKDEPPPGPVSSGVASFNKDAASQALAVAASQTSICKKPDGPTGQGKVQVTFAASGRATTANIVAGPFAGTAVGGCVSGVFKRAKVPPFAGDAVTVSKSFSIVP